MGYTLFSKYLLLSKYKIELLYKRMLIIKWRCLGLELGENSKIGKVYFNSPGLVKIGCKCEIRDSVSFWLKNPFDEKNKIVIGDNVFIGRSVEFNCSGEIMIGDNCLIASSVVFVDSGHIFDKLMNINNQPIQIKNIIVEEDVWIGSGAIILKGVVIGRGSIVGANSVVNKLIPPYEIWAGCPAKKIGERK